MAGERGYVLQERLVDLKDGHDSRVQIHVRKQIKARLNPDPGRVKDKARLSLKHVSGGPLTSTRSIVADLTQFGARESGHQNIANGCHKLCSTR